MLFKIVNQLKIPTASLSLFRIILAISVFYNLFFVKLPYATQFYGQNPIIPLSVFQNMNGVNSFSIFDFVRNDNFAYFFIVLGIMGSIAMGLGLFRFYSTIFTTFIYWNILQASSTYIFGFDFFTFQMLFWACFLPLDNHFTVHKIQNKAVGHWLFGFVLLVQISWVYFSSAVCKYGESWSGGYAVHNMLMDFWATKPLAAYIVNQPILYTPLT